MNMEEWWVFGTLSTPFGVQSAQLKGPFVSKALAIEEAKKNSRETMRVSKVLRTMTKVDTIQNTLVEDV